MQKFNASEQKIATLRKNNETLIRNYEEINTMLNVERQSSAVCKAELIKLVVNSTMFSRFLNFVFNTTFTRDMGINLGMVTFLFVYEVRLHDKKVGYRYRLGIRYLVGIPKSIPIPCVNVV